MTVKELTWYWVAINGASVAISEMPMGKKFAVHPVPEQLYGFPTSKEAKAAQQLLLTASIPECQKAMRRWHARKDIVVLLPRNPEPPTKGQTAWVPKGEAMDCRQVTAADIVKEGL